MRPDLSMEGRQTLAETDMIANFQTESCKEPVEAHVLEDTPFVLSEGTRCMNLGYAFVWPPNREPYMIDPDGSRVSLFVKWDIPYARVGSSKSTARKEDEGSAMAGAVVGFLLQGTWQCCVLDDDEIGALADSEPPPGEEFRNPRQEGQPWATRSTCRRYGGGAGGTPELGDDH